MVFKGVFNIRGKGLLLDNLRNNPIIIHNINIFFIYYIVMDYSWIIIIGLYYYHIMDY